MTKPTTKDARATPLAAVMLAPITRADAPVLFEWINDRELVLLSSAYQPVHETTHRAWLQGVSHRSDSVVCAIRLRRSRRLIGVGQLSHISRVHRSAELQIRIGDARWRGRGLGTAAVRLLVNLAFEDLNLHRVFLHVFRTNTPAIRSYERAGFTQEGTLRDAVHLDGRYVDVLVMAVLRNERAA